MVVLPPQGASDTYFTGNYLTQEPTLYAHRVMVFPVNPLP